MNWGLGVSVVRHENVSINVALTYSTSHKSLLEIFPLQNPVRCKHYNDVIMGAMASKITSLAVVYSTLYLGEIKENIKAPRHWPLCGEFTGDSPAQMASNAENVSIWWRHRVINVNTMERQSVDCLHSERHNILLIVYRKLAINRFISEPITVLWFQEYSEYEGIQKALLAYLLHIYYVRL